MDANVIIDFHLADLSVLGLVCRYVGEVHVLSTVLAEAPHVSAAMCERLGLQVIEPSLDQVYQAAANRGALSFQDHLCLLTAQDQGYTCVTNDKPLRRACRANGVPVWWGLELMVSLVGMGAMSATEAIRVAELIHAANPFHITRAIVDQFTLRVRAG